MEETPLGKNETQKKCGICSGTHPELLTNMQSWKCSVCECVLLSKAGYMNHLKVHVNNKKQANYINPSPHSASNTSVVCNQVCEAVSVSGLNEANGSSKESHRKFRLKHPS